MRCECRYPNKPKVILNQGSEVCNFCPIFKDECLRMEKLAKKILRLPRHEGVRAYRTHKDKVGNTIALDGVIKRLKGA